MIVIEPHVEGSLLPVHAQPGAKRNAVVGEQNGSLKVAVTQVAEKGKANAAIGEVLAAALGVRKSQIALVSGDTGRQKRFLIRGLAPEELAERVSNILNGSGP